MKTKVALAATVALLLVASCTMSEAADACGFYPYADSSGYDIAHYTDVTFYACSILCAAEPRCKLFTVAPSNKSCWLKYQPNIGGGYSFLDRTTVYTDGVDCSSHCKPFGT